MLEFIQDDEPVYDHLVNTLNTLEHFIVPFRSYSLRESDPFNALIEKITNATVQYIFKDDYEIVQPILYIFQGLSERNPEVVAEILLKEGALARIIMQCLEVGNNHRILIRSIRILANCLAADNEKITVALIRDMRLLKKVKNMIHKYQDNHLVKGDLLFLASNVPIKHRDVLDIFAQEVLEEVIDSMGDQTLRLRQEAATALDTFLKYGSSVHIRQAVERKALQGIRALMHFKDQRLLVVILESLEIILQDGEKQLAEGNTVVNHYWLQFTKITGEAKLAELVEHPAESVYKKAAVILHTYKIAAEEIQNEPPAQEERIEL